jgi:hypothetical protein
MSDLQRETDHTMKKNTLEDLRRSSPGEEDPQARPAPPRWPIRCDLVDHASIAFEDQ